MYEKLEKKCQHLAALNDAPLWSVGTYRGVVSKIDLLFAIAGSITQEDLKRYFALANMVLGEDDPKLDLPESERWAAAIHGKSREFSAALREGVSETMVLLAVHGNPLFRARLGFDCELAVNRLVRHLLKPLKTRILEANNRDLTAYAEAAPDEFLSVLEKDLESDQPQTYGLMRPIEAGLFGGNPRAGLLWALEGLAWNPGTLPRVALILAQLAEIEINDNWSNKPIRSLESIFRASMPQTAADHNSRLRVMKMLAEKFPKVAWKICIAQLETRHQIGDHGHKPKWRNDGQGFGELFPTREPIVRFMREMADMALAWKSGYMREMVCDLIQTLHGLDDAYRAKVWDLVATWAAGASDADKSFVREKIRVTFMSRRAAKRPKKSGFAALLVAAKAAYQALEPSDLLNKHEWLFREHWVEETADELHDDDTDFQKREARTSKLRADALRKVFKARGLTGIVDLAEMGKVASQIGWLMVREVLQEGEVLEFLLATLPPTSNSDTLAKRNLLFGSFRAIDDDKRRIALLMEAKRQLPPAVFLRLLLLAPFRRSTWQLVDKLDEGDRQAYWIEVLPDWAHGAEDETREAIERLLAAQRPRAAFALVHFKLETLGPELLFRLMSDMLKDGKDRPAQYELEQHYIQEAFKILDKCPLLTLEQKAGLELAYIDALYERWRGREIYGIPNLEKYVELHPEFFTQAIVWTYKRNDGGEDPSESKVGPDQVKRLAERGQKLLEALHSVPGHDDLGELQVERLAEWVKKVRDACASLGRLEVADFCVGKLLSVAPVGKDGVWPCEPVRQVMEDVRSKAMMEGAHNGLYNSRGVTLRGEGGGQERALADKYRAWANALQYSHPFVASELLMDMVKTYEYEASRWDTEAGIRRRLP